ncbi:hypothetical protein N7456_012973 [Penicillium angulare]|uniref:Uncharacterized protein n=1 Tax=Penicillium angulare TaxID=116970 RepID=A0A9W9EKU5_9EURO|nr:hypothetical protein N7456_012973 [Penicillium angulare]
MVLSKGELARCMRMLLKGGLLGDYVGKAVMGSTFKQNEKSITFIAGLVDLETEAIGERHLISLNKADGALVSMTHVTSTEEEMKTILSEASLEVPMCREIIQLDKGSYGVSYKVSFQDSAKQVIVQLRYHGDVDSMNNLAEYLSENLSAVLPVLRAYRTTLRVSSVHIGPASAN